MNRPVNYYGCVKCQTQHFEDTDPRIYSEHIMWQSKHGVKQCAETIEERAARYGIHLGDNAKLLEMFQRAEGR
jgi:hypothetical protein